MSNTVLKTVTKADIQEVKEAAERLYMGRVGGYAEDFLAQPDRHGNYPRRMFRGALEEFTATGVNALLDLIFDKISQGYKRSETPTSTIGQLYLTYLIKPDAVIAEELVEEFKEAERSLRASIERVNEEIVAKTVAQRKAQVLKERGEAAKAADAALEAELEAEVRAALKGGK